MAAGALWCTPAAPAFLQYSTDCSLQSWQNHGQDRHSQVADPQFVALSSTNFALQPSSPALALGFQPIDTSSIGPRPLHP